MSKFYCEDCGSVFDEPGTYYESRPIGEEKFDCCPDCSGRDYVEYRFKVKEQLEKWLNEQSVEFINIVFELFENDEVCV